MREVWEAAGRSVNLNAFRALFACTDRLGRWVLPPRCLVCGEAGQQALDLCLACHAELPWNERACARCALPLPRPAAACGVCLRTPPPQSICIAPLLYTDPIDRLLSAFKFRAGLAQGRLLMELADARMPSALWTDVDVVVPLPLHRQRLGERGYNQALELARPLAARWQRPLHPQALRRIRATAAQSELDAAARRRNVRGAFMADAAQVHGRRVLLIDDVVTTGATVMAAAKATIDAGAVEVRVLAVARAPPPKGG